MNSTADDVARLGRVFFVFINGLQVGHSAMATLPDEVRCHACVYLLRLYDGRHNVQRWRYSVDEVNLEH
jgi:hypothetical protein